MRPFRALYSYLVVLGLLSAGLLPTAVVAQPGITAYELPRNAEYERRIAFNRLQSELVYIDRLEGEIPMDGVPRYQAPEAPGDETRSRAVPNTGRALLAVMALAIIGLALRYGGTVVARFGHAQSARGRGARDTPAATAPGSAEDGGALLSRLRRMEDREAALVILIKAVLTEAADQNGLRLGRAETARELVRRIPVGWRHIADLRRIVMTEELVQFGGRALAGRSFEDCLARAHPILSPAAGGGA